MKGSIGDIVGISSVKQVRSSIPADNNFDFLRFVFAFSVLMVHIYGLSLSPDLRPLTYIFDAGLAVKAFFVISGFLIFMSYERASSLAGYFKNRVKRIYPAYVFVVMFCAIFGVAISTLSWHQYYGHTVLKYLLANLIFLNFLQPTLPGVFEDQPLSVVNGALWTIKIEVMFYLSVPVLAWLIRRFKPLACVPVLYILSLAYAHGMDVWSDQTNSRLVEELSKQLPAQLSYFISGALVYYYFETFKRYKHLIFAMALGACIIGGRYHFDWVFPLALAGIVMYVAFFVPGFTRFGKYGDFSYGIYIIHFPVVQTLVHIGLFRLNPYLALVICVAVVLALAAASWHFVEKRFLKKDVRRDGQALLALSTPDRLSAGQIVNLGSQK